MIKGVVNKIIPFSAVDGPGNRTVIFLQSCNFNCLYCHNPETINFCNHCGICANVCNSSALLFANGKISWNSSNCINCDNCIKICPHFSSPKTLKLSVPELFERIEKYKLFTSGITVSGGECTEQYEFLSELLKFAQKKGISAFLDTNCSLEPQKMEELSKYCDKIMPDLKSFSNFEHKKITSKNNINVLKNTENLLAEGKIYEIRTVVFPDFIENEENINKIAKLISKYRPDTTFKLISFRKNGVRNSDLYKEPEPEYMLKLKFIAQNAGCNNVIIV